MRNIIADYEGHLGEHLAYAAAIESFRMDDHITGTIDVDWPLYAKLNRADGEGVSYEDRLFNACSTPGHSDRVFLLVGSAGSGKTSALLFCRARRNLPGDLYINLHCPD